MYHFKGSFNSYSDSEKEENKSKKRIYFTLSKPFYIQNRNLKVLFGF